VVGKGKIDLLFSGANTLWLPSIARNRPTGQPHFDISGELPIFIEAKLE
jgi:hypothetical protein